MLIIRWMPGVAEIIHNDPNCNELLKIMVLSDYNGRPGQKIEPQADRSEPISTTGVQTSGTEMMKLAVPGALTSGSLDGADVGCRAPAGANQPFLFGHLGEPINALLPWADPWPWLARLPPLAEALSRVEAAAFSQGDRDFFVLPVQSLKSRDP